MPYLNEPIDISGDFSRADNTFFIADQLAAFDPQTGSGRLRWNRSQLATTFLFNVMKPSFKPIEANERPQDIYAANPELPFAIEFVSASTLRLRFSSRATAPSQTQAQTPSVMLAGEPQDDGSWTRCAIEGGWEFKSSQGTVVLRENPWKIEVRDAAGRMLTDTCWDKSKTPFCFLRRNEDYSRSFSAVFSLAPGEKIFGCGESFTRLDKRGQKVVLSVTDALGVEGPQMYKPVPFFLSNRGYGMFVHTSAPITCDFGATHFDRNILTVGDDELDLFVFLGTPREILDAYTEVVGKAPLPPLWSFGLWMSRITYDNEPQAREVARKLRENRVPCDVIHLDTGWFETDWECDYEFSPSRFSDPQGMINDLRRDHFHLCLWQLPYFVPRNKLFPEIVENGLAVKDAKGNVPFEDAVLDFSNPKTVAWYQEKLGNLLKMGVSAIKTDFGEGAPFSGHYASGRSGFYEHNLYPVRYQAAVAGITREIGGEHIIWARAGWAGSQRFPLHWGGDAGRSFSAMLASLRGGLSLGASGFSFWSHDIGGFGGKPRPELYRLWLPFGLLTSHSRVHGEPPTEPWEFGAEFLDEFRRADEMRYRLMPYIYAQAKDCSERGLPMLRALFIEFPDDAGAWTVEDEYLFGSSLLVAPLFEANATGRDVYLPAGTWIDYQTGKVYCGGWHRIEAGAIPVGCGCATAASFRASLWRKARSKWTGRNSNSPSSRPTLLKHAVWCACRKTNSCAR